VKEDLQVDKKVDGAKGIFNFRESVDDKTSVDDSVVNIIESPEAKKPLMPQVHDWVAR